jgi:hypothetical protein
LHLLIFPRAAHTIAVARCYCDSKPYLNVPFDEQFLTSLLDSDIENEEESVSESETPSSGDDLLTSVEEETNGNVESTQTDQNEGFDILVDEYGIAFSNNLLLSLFARSSVGFKVFVQVLNCTIEGHIPMLCCQDCIHITVIEVLLQDNTLRP